MKRGFLKYLIIFLISFIPLVAFNIFAYAYINIRWIIVLLDCILLLVFVVLGNHIANKIFEKKDAKLEAKRKARDEMQKRKKQILEDSYKRIREEKKKNKEESKDDVVVVEDNIGDSKSDEQKEDDVSEDKVKTTTIKKSTSNKKSKDKK